VLELLEGGRDRDQAVRRTEEKGRRRSRGGARGMARGRREASRCIA
jgi:hypothetical protein